MTLSRKGQSLFDMTSENFGRLDECVKFMRDNGFDFKTEVPSDTELVVDNPVGVGDDNNKEAIKVQKLSFNNEYVIRKAMATVTFTVKDPHAEVQESVKVYKNDMLVGSTDVNGQIVSMIEEGDILVLGKSGFFIKAYNVTLDTAQEIIMSYVVPTVKIGAQIWQSENLVVDDLQGGTRPPNGDVNNVADYGLLYKGTDLNRIPLLIPYFKRPSNSNLSSLSSFLGGDSVSGGKLKETGITYWDDPNTGATNESNFSGRGAGLYGRFEGVYEFFKERLFITASDFGGSYYLRNINDDFNYESIWNDNIHSSIRLIKSSTPDTFIFSISVNSGGAAVQGATVSVEGNDYVTDANGQVFIEEYKTNVNFTVSKTGYVTATGSIDLTSEFTKIVSLVNEVTIGTQTWSAFNLDIDDGQGGIISVNDGSGYGKLYTYAAAQRIADSVDGWRLPTESDIDTLTTFVGGASVAGKELKETGTTYWNTTGGTNTYGFNGRGAGGYNSGYFNFQQLQEFWTSTDGGPANTKVTQKMSATTDSSFKGALDVNFWSVSLRLIKE